MKEYLTQRIQELAAHIVQLGSSRLLLEMLSVLIVHLVQYLLLEPQLVMSVQKTSTKTWQDKLPVIIVD